ncbi:MAG: WecB/TagA/CpsF family glycosyltransferase [Clostridiales bacterium]|nr:WecB/TagA/CpsF family glycosyltransferase [Clostridiales bacterium]MCF8022932.1 WecB/TagA/CpsF family glycosyltransferase [Clostridiales bacterium]
MKVELLGSFIDALSMQETENKIAELIERGGGHHVVTLNPEYLYRAQFEPGLLDLVNSADLVTPDGEGIVWACRVALRPVPERVTGIDIMLRLSRRASEEGWRVFLLGASPGVAEDAARGLEQRFPGLQVAGTYHGYFKDDEEEEVLETIKKACPHIIFAALGAPRQENWINRYLEQLNCLAMGVGGSFDVLAGKVPRAPFWIQRVKVEWLYRMVQEPSRCKRVAVLPRFAWLVLKNYRLKT